MCKRWWCSFKYKLAFWSEKYLLEKNTIYDSVHSAAKWIPTWLDGTNYLAEFWNGGKTWMQGLVVNQVTYLFRFVALYMRMKRYLHVTFRNRWYLIQIVCLGWLVFKILKVRVVVRQKNMKTSCNIGCILVSFTMPYWWDNMKCVGDNDFL